MLIQIIKGNLSGIQIITALFAMAFVVFCTLPIHEWAHAFAAHKLGDDTAKNQGRLTINPVAHIDWLGAILIFLVGFGYAKPVPINSNNFKKKKLGMFITAFAGPFSNLVMGFIFVFLQMLFTKLGTSVVFNAFSLFFRFAATVNIGLAVFNLLPIPPLDGSRLWQAILSEKWVIKMSQYESFIMIGVFILIFFGILDKPLSFLRNAVYYLFVTFFNLFM